MAAQTFHNFLILLALALIALVPDDSARTLLIIGVQGVIRVTRDLRQARRDPDPRWSAGQALLRYAVPLAAYLICLGLAIDLWDGRTDALGWSVAVVFCLPVNAVANCWDLLEASGNQGPPDA